MFLVDADEARLVKLPGASVTVRTSLGMPMCGRCKKAVDAIVFQENGLHLALSYVVTCHGEVRRVDIDVDALEPGRAAEQIVAKLAEAFPAPRVVHAPLEDDWDSGAWSPVTEGR